MGRLLEIGFERAGEWSLDDDELVIEIEHYAHAANVLYAFVSGEELLFIGRCGRSLKSRMQGYEGGGPPRSMRERNRERIIAMLVINRPVELYVMSDPGNLHYRSFRVNLAAGLQHSLIEALSPPWNGAAGKPRSHGHRLAKSRARKGPQRSTDTDGETYTDLTRDLPSYRFLVGYMYMDQGFFNVPLRYSRLFGKDREKIKIMCGVERVTIHGQIDRAANTNDTPRIVGGPALRNWFERNAELNSPVDIDILAPNAIWLRPAEKH